MRGIALVAIVLTLFVPAVSSAAEQSVDLELALAVDVSGSVDGEEALLQRYGYVDAFRHPDVIRAIEHGILGRIAVAYYEWAGFGHMRVIVGWTEIAGRPDAEAFALALTRNPPVTARRTAISSAIDFAAPWFEGNGFEGTRRVIDISGDGANNWGGPVTVARDRAVALGVTINGLPIVNGRPGPGGFPQDPNLDLYYRDCVIGGAGAFYIAADGFESFAEAIRRKLIVEIAGGVPGPAAGAIPVQYDGRVAPPCDIGERRMRSYDDF